MATRLARAARETRVRYQHPAVTLVLPRIQSGAHSAIDSMLEGIRQQGITVVSGRTVRPAPTLAAAAATMLYDEFSRFSATVNVDCTVLLALASDISHARVADAPWFNRAIRRQLEIEDREQLLPTVLWPALTGRRLVCTAEAARRMRDITALIGTDAERARMAVLLDGCGTEQQSREVLRALSCHDVPEDLILPIRVCDRVAVEDERLPQVARKVAEQLTDINQSVFLFGWAEGITTVTSNRTAAKVIETTVEEHRTYYNEAGPDVWICSTSRSLVAKEKNRKGYE
jgi:hypothetical protein